MIDKFLGVKFAKLSFLEKLWLLAPVAIWFSYWPKISLGQDATSNYELSITLIYLLILALVGLPNIWQDRKLLARNHVVWLVGSFVVLGFLSLVWTDNFTRGFLTAGIIGLLFAVFLAALAERKRFNKLLPALTKLFITVTLGMCVLALVQIIAGIWLARSSALLCAGCVANQFGFVRPNVFTIEPQFLGSLLLAPALIVLHEFLSEKRNKLTALSLVLISSVLLLTLSRGAIFAFAFGAILLFALNYQKIKILIHASVLMLCGLVIALVLQGSAAALNPKLNVTFVGAISASVNHLSMGVIDLPENKAVVVAPENTNTNAPVFSGYVEESTETRQSLSRLAYDTWVDNPVRIVFGVGLGGSGVAMNSMYPNKVDKSEIVQNEYMEILLEYGVFGILIFASIIVALFCVSRHNKWLWAIIVAYLVQWNFFSGYPNALHIYLVLIALCAMSLFVAAKNDSKRL